MKERQQPAIASDQPFRIPGLDGMRAISFMLVFVAHAGLGHLVPGGLGVTVFFFLSGYLITTLLRLERERSHLNSFRDFYLRRAFRILPPFYSVLALAIFLNLCGALPGPLHLGSVLSQLAHLTNYWILYRDREGFPAGTIVYWSLAVEEHFYLVFPALFVLLQWLWPKRYVRQAWALLGLCLLVAAWRLLLKLYWDASEVRLTISTDTRIDSILFGCALALLANPMLDPERGSASLWRRGLFPAGLGLLALTLFYRAAWFRETLRYSLQGIALVPLFVVAIRYPAWAPVRWLNQRWLARVGVLSYSLYLCHQVFLIALESTLLPVVGNKLVTGVVALVVSLVTAWLIERWVERPSARARKLVIESDWLRPAPVRDAQAST